MILSETSADGDDSGKDGILDFPALIKPLAPDHLALFEELSAVMLLNIEEEEWQAVVRRSSEGASTPDDIRLARTMDHETWHFAQAAASGYMFERQRTACQVLNAAPPSRHPLDDPDTVETIARFRDHIGDDPDAHARLEAVLRLARANDALEELRARALPGDPSIAGAALPDFFAHLRRRREIESAVNAEGLSILGLLEGSAVIASNLLYCEGDEAVGHVRAEVEALPPVYGELFDYSWSQVGDRAIGAALPAAAVALCYARPNDAYCALLPMVAAGSAEEARALGRALFEAAPAIEAAGPWLGDSVARRDADDSYLIYDPFLDGLRCNAWGVDCYDLLADPRAVYRTNRAPLAMVTRSAPHGTSDPAEIGARVYLMSIVLKVQSRLRAEREHVRDLTEWGRAVASRLGEDFRADPPADPE